MQRLPFTVHTPVLIVLLVVLCLLAAYDLIHQYQMSNEAYWFYQYTEALRSSPEFWNFGYRLERLEQKNDKMNQHLNSLKHRLIDDSTSFRKATAPHIAMSQNIARMLQNDSNLVQIRCGDTNGLLRLGASDFRADPRDACQLFSGTITTAPGPETTFEKVYQLDGAFGLRSISSNLYLQVVPPPPDNFAAPWKVSAASPVVGPGERFWMTEEGYLYNAMLSGYLQCSNEDMVKGFPGLYSGGNVFELDPVSIENVNKYRQLVSLSDQIEKIQHDFLKESKQKILKERLINSNLVSSEALSKDKIIKICIGVPMTSTKTNMLVVSESPLWTNLFSSFMETVDWKSARFQYVFYLGFDKADPIYDTGDAWQELREEFAKRATMFLKTQLLHDDDIEKILKKTLSIKLFHFEHLEGAPSQIVSQVMLQAYGDGFDYFYQVNDDTQLNSLNWADNLVEALLNSEPVPNFGVTGPRDSNNEKIFTHSFIHRTHIEIFGHLFPPSFKNWWSDDWISTVYGESYTFLLSNVLIRHNVEAQKTAGYTRYEVDKGAKLRLDDELRDGYIKINKWLRNSKYPTLPLPIICNYIPLSRMLYDPLTSLREKKRDETVLKHVK